MSVLQVYMNWANSLLKPHQILSDITQIQNGVILCQLIDALDRNANLEDRVQAKPSSDAKDYLETALEYIHSKGIKTSFCTQDILDKDVKSMLDALWQIILNFCIHPIERNPTQRSVGIAKKALLEWTQKQLGTDFDAKNSLAYNLCKGDWFLKLLEKYTGTLVAEHTDKAEQIGSVLKAAEGAFGVKADIINPGEIIDGTVDEHTLLIYLSLLQRRVDPHFFEDALKASKDYSVRHSHKQPLSNVKEEPVTTRNGVTWEEKTHSELSTKKSREEEEKTKEPQNTKDTRDSSPSPSVYIYEGLGRRVRLQRPRSHKIIMAEAQEKLEAEMRRKELEEIKKEREKEQERRLAQEAAYQQKQKASSEDDESLGSSGEQLPMFSALPPKFFSGAGQGVPVIVVPGQGQDVMMLMQALKQARSKVNFHDSQMGMSEETTPKVQLLDLNAVDDEVPSMQPHPKSSTPILNGRDEGSPVGNKNLMSSPAKDQRKSPSLREHSLYNGDSHSSKLSDRLGQRYSSPKKEDYSASESESRDLHQKRGMYGSREEIDFSQESESQSEPEGRRFPRVDLTDPVKAIIRRDSSERNEDNRSRSHSPRERRALTPGTDTVPKSILRNKSPSSSMDPYGAADKPNYDSSGSERSLDRPRSRSPYDGGHRARSPGYASPRGDRSPRDSRSRTPTLHQSDSDDKDLRRDLTPGRQDDEPDPNRRLVRVLNKELELLRLKMDVLEQTNDSNENNLEDLNKMTRELSERVKDAVSKRVGSQSPASPRRRRSPEPVERGSDYNRGRMFRKNEDSDHGLRSRSESRLYRSFRNSPDRDLLRRQTLSKSLQDLSMDNEITEAPDGQISLSPHKRGKPISLGYASPIRKVSEEIWGVGDEGLEEFNERQVEKWRQLILASDNSDIVELKQALGTAISQNDILSAQLKNATSDITAKMSKTNDVLNDCRSHLAKAQAENMELRTQLEKERSRNESLEVRHREIESQLTSAKSTNDELEVQLEKTRTLLKGTPKRDIPTLESLAEERDSLLDLVATTQKENTRVSQENETLKKQLLKTKNTIKDLKGILDDAIKERTELYDEIKQLQKEGHLSQMSGIIQKYMDNSLYNGMTNGFVRSRSNSLSSQQSYGEPEVVIQRPKSPVQLRTSSSERSRRLSPVAHNASKYTSNSIPSPYRPATPVDSVDGDYDYDFEETVSVPSHYREIYPHRRTSSYRAKVGSSLELDGRHSPSDFMDDVEVQKLMRSPPVQHWGRARPTSPSRRSPVRGRFGSRSPRNSRSPVSRKLNYSPVGIRASSLSPERVDVVESIVESPIDKQFMENNCESPVPKKHLDINENNRFFLDALYSAVKNENGKRKLFDATDVSEIKKILAENRRNSSISRSLSPTPTQKPGRSPSPSTLRGILKPPKGDQDAGIDVSCQESPRIMQNRFNRSSSPSPSSKHTRSSSSPVSPLVGTGSYRSAGNRHTFGQGKKVDDGIKSDSGGRIFGVVSPAFKPW